MTAVTRPTDDRSRYARQALLPQVGDEGQRRLRAARALVVGVGALGSSIAEQLARAGVGRLRIVDRDVVEVSNLQRQVLFDEGDARDGTPKAMAAARRLRAINSSIEVEPHVVDVTSDIIVTLARDIDVILDGTDNAATRYLINDAAVSLGKPWVYGACVGIEGRVMAVAPAFGRPCLRCVFPDPPGAGELPTCDTAGVLGPVAAMVANWQAIAAIQLLLGRRHAIGAMLSIDGWRWSVRSIDVSTARRDDCPCCGRGRFEFLDASPQTGAVLCGRDAVQVRPPRKTTLDLPALADRLKRSVGEIRTADSFVRVHVPDAPGVSITAFADGRAIVQGISDLARARSLYDRYIGG